MFDTDTQGLAGPEFLDAVADAEEANGNCINAAEYRKRARQWRQDVTALDDATAALADIRRRRTDVPALRRSHAITPTDRA